MNNANPVEVTKDIYKITNNINGKIYVGQSKDAKRRFQEHCKPSNKSGIIDLAIQKYGKMNFSLEILETQILNYNERERYWIKKLNSKVPFGYNITDGGENPPIFLGIHHPLASIKSQEILNKIIFDLAETKDSYLALAKRYQTNKKTILGINHGFRYFDKNLSYPIRKTPNLNGILTDQDVEAIIEELTYSYESNTVIGQHYGVGEHTIRNINAGRSHFKEGVTYPIRPENAVRSKVSYDQLLEIVYLLQKTDLSMRQIAKRYYLDHSTIQNINIGSKVYFRREFTYPLRLPPHKK